MFLNRWRCCCTTSVPLFTCGTCTIPKANLTVTYHNGVIGDGTAVLVWDGVNNWQSVCTNQVIYQILCNAGTPEFRVRYFISGSCPTGQSAFCSTLGSNPLKLTKDSLVCGASFDIEVSVTNAGCPNLWGNGYTSFSITYP